MADIWDDSDEEDAPEPEAHGRSNLDFSIGLLHVAFRAREGGAYGSAYGLALAAIAVYEWTGPIANGTRAQQQIKYVGQFSKEIIDYIIAEGMHETYFYDNEDDERYARVDGVDFHNYPDRGIEHEIHVYDGFGRKPSLEAVDAMIDRACNLDAELQYCVNFWVLMGGDLRQPEL